MTIQPVVTRDEDRRWETWPEQQVAERGDSAWKTLIGAGPTETNALTLGVSRLPPDGVLPTHRHEAAEVYYVLAGSGAVTIDGERHAIAAGDAVFVPGSAPHSVESTGTADLRMVYVLAADSFEDVIYVFGD
jgi:mannose-6-phosphate isomerase-like protein (cupin superfamily)